MHPLEPLTAAEVQLAVTILKDAGMVTPTTRFISVSLKEPSKDVVRDDQRASRVSGGRS
jgi:primary-amine oxidase